MAHGENACLPGAIIELNLLLVFVLAEKVFLQVLPSWKELF